MTPHEIIAFWSAVGEPRWFEPDAMLDSEISRRFGETYALAREGKLADWEKTAEGALALLILLDQFPRNMFRGGAEAFATDPLACAIAKRAIASGFDLAIESPMRCFFYLPFTHSERIDDQESGVTLTGERLGIGSKQHVYAVLHRDVIAKFRRFPGRNAALGRRSTPEEAQFLSSNPPF